ncbi:MAG: DUF167 domain-containing protein [Candidatus Nomurabacteria bacterium]|nr:DUF167 domain-containing protein [Candidatus Nomurabacteria bacterium]
MYIHVKAFPGAKKESITQETEERYRIFVREGAVRNMANYRVREILSNEFGVPINAVQIISGNQGHKKVVEIDDRALESVE